MISAKRVSAAVNDSTVTIEWYKADDHIILTINGMMCQFATNVGPNYSGSKEDTIQALKEAAAEL